MLPVHMIGGFQHFQRTKFYYFRVEQNRTSFNGKILIPIFSFAVNYGDRCRQYGQFRGFNFPEIELQKTILFPALFPIDPIYFQFYYQKTRFIPKETGLYTDLKRGFFLVFTILSGVYENILNVTFDLFIDKLIYNYCHRNFHMATVSEF